MEKRKDTRSLTINNEEWQYKIGKKTVLVYEPSGERHFPQIINMVGEQNYKDRNYKLNPAFILNYIKVEILKEEAAHDTCKYCGEVGSDVTLTNNPFDSEIHEDYTNHFMCGRCIEDSINSI